MPPVGQYIGMYADGVLFFVGILVLIVVFFSAAGLYSARERRRHPGRQGPAEPWRRWEPGSPRPARPTAHDILSERMARHEITGEQYDELMSVLGPDPYDGADAT